MRHSTSKENLPVRSLAIVVALVLVSAFLVSCSRSPQSGPEEGAPALMATAAPGVVSPGGLAGGPPPPGAPTASDRPFRLARMTELWVFTVDKTTYTAHGELAITRATPPFGFVAVAAPMTPGHQATNVRVSPTVRLASYQPAKNPQGFPAFSPILELKAPQAAGATVPFELSAEWDVVPYVHGTGMAGRLLSLTFGHQPDRPERRYAFAFPETSQIKSLTDSQPVASRTIPGWKLYEYEAPTIGDRMTIHISFDYGKATQPPPPISVVLGDKK